MSTVANSVIRLSAAIEHGTNSMAAGKAPLAVAIQHDTAVESTT